MHSTLRNNPDLSPSFSPRNGVRCPSTIHSYPFPRFLPKGNTQDGGLGEKEDRDHSCVDRRYKVSYRFFFSYPSSLLSLSESIFSSLIIDFLMYVIVAFFFYVSSMLNPFFKLFFPPILAFSCLFFLFSPFCFFFFRESYLHARYRFWYVGKTSSFRFLTIFALR